MFNKTYSRAMKNGSRLLFAIAVLLFLSGALEGIRLLVSVSIAPFGPNNEPRWEWHQLVNAVLNALSWAVMPLFGALVVDRADRWLDRGK
jgi:hypothetical protein